MTRFVETVLPLNEVIETVSKHLAFPWPLREEERHLGESLCFRTSRAILAGESLPSFTKSLRDGYAVNSADLSGASSGYPIFLRVIEGVEMGVSPRFSVGRGEASPIATGGELPGGADCVVMLENTTLSSSILEVRRELQAGDNVVFTGEEIRSGSVLITKGTAIDFRKTSILASLGVENFFCLDLKIGILSTGDEIRPIETKTLPQGCIRDTNAHMLDAFLKRNSFHAERIGIVPDIAEEMERAVKQALERFDVLLLSGGSSVGMRDHTSAIMKKLPEPGLLVHGINIAPGKPTLIAACQDQKKLVIGLPGHPLSCLITSSVLLIPLLHKMIGAHHEKITFKLPLVEDVHGRAGVEEFVPASVVDGWVKPIHSKSSYVFQTGMTDGLIRLPDNQETARRGEVVEFCPW